MTIKILNASAIRHLHSGQVIVDILAIVKELLENSLDAHATSIDLVFMNNGLEFVQIKDNGEGIEECDRICVAKRHYTSKLSDFHDLEVIQSYGFRGEALNSICVVSDKVVITTKTKTDPIAKQYDVNKEGTISNEKVANTIASSGTIVTLYKPFYNLPVRRQLAQKNATSTMRKVQELLTKYALAHPNVRFTCTQSTNAGGRKPSNNTWIKPITETIETSVSILFGPRLADITERFIETDEEDPILTVDVVLPKKNSDPSIVLKGPENIFFYCNQRPINYVKSELKDIVSNIRVRYKDAIGLNVDNNQKIPFIYVDIQIPPSEYDVNVEPDKTTVLFHKKDRIYNIVKKILDDIYPTKMEKFFNKPDSQVSPPSVIQKNSTPPTSDWNTSMLEDMDPNVETRNKENTSRRTGMENWQIDNASSSVPDKTVTTRINVTDDEPDRSLENTRIRIDKVSPEAPQKSVDPKNANMTSSSSVNSSSLLNKTSRITDFMPTTSKKRALEDDSIHRSTIVSDVENNGPQMIRQVQKVPRIHSPPPQNVGSHKPALSSLQQLQTRSETHVNLPGPSELTLREKRQSDLSSRSSLTQAPKKSLPIVTRKAPHMNQLCNTLNQSLVVDCNIEDVKATYPRRKEILSESYRIRLQDYMVMNDYDRVGQITKLLKSPPGLEKHGLSFYTRANPSVIDKHRHQICQLGVVKLKPLYIHAIVNRLAKEHKIICKRAFERPVQMYLDPQDTLCPVLLSLKSKEQLVDDDLHGQKKITYSEIVDDIIVWNGFKARWRKDLYSGKLIVQLTGIYSLGSGYGTADFRELLSLMADSRKGDFVRPKKLMDHLKSIAEEIFNTSKQLTDYSMRDIEKGLESLSWVKGDNAWELGRSKIENEVLACTLNSLNL